MSNFYISKCCSKPVNSIFRDGNTVGVFICIGCGKECYEVTAVIDESVKQYQEDIKAGVEVSGKTEQIRESELQDEFMDFWDEYKDKVGLGNYSDEVTRFWLQKLSEQKQDMLSTIKGLGCNPENDSLTIARILNELR